MLKLKDDPWFNEQAVINRVKNLWLQRLTCLCDWDLEPMKPYFSESQYQKELDLISQDRSAMRMSCFERPAVLDASLEEGPVSAGRQTLVCRLFTRFTPQAKQKGTGKLLVSGKEMFFHEDWLLSRPAETKTPAPGAAFSVNCPNCGAPFSLYKSAKCPMCHSLIPVPDFTWTVDSITGRAG